MRVQPATDAGDPTTGTQLGKYQLLATLGQGGMGTVHLALASGLGQFRKLLVVKELRQDLTRQPGFVTMFMDEAKLAARLAHPNVVQTFEASALGDRYLLAMEYLDGYPLSSLLERLSRAPISKLTLWMHLQILCDVLAGLHYAHELLDYDGTSLQVVHRDVSPQNVFITYHGQVKVVDFGVAKAANAMNQTAPGTFVGKFSYASPEQVLGSGVDARTDVFAVGVMLWEAIARRPFSESEPTPTACRARVEGQEPRIADVVPTVDPVLARICDRALAVDVDERFASAKELRFALQNYMQLAGVRVETAEIGLLMQEVFETERRALHNRIELAVRHIGVSDATVGELPIFHGAEKVPTAVADLSSLVEVSLEQDEHKLRQSYAHSKVTLVRSNGQRETVDVSPSAASKKRRRALVFVGLSVLVGVSLAMLTRSNEQEPGVTSQGSFATSATRPDASSSGRSLKPAQESPQESAHDSAHTADQTVNQTANQAANHEVAARAPVVSSPSDTRKLGQPTRSSDRASEPLGDTTYGSNDTWRDSVDRSTAKASAPASTSPNARRETLTTSTSRSRTQVIATSRSAPSEDPVSEPARAITRESTRAKASASVGSATQLEEGADLPFGRRLPAVYIDSDNPYKK